VTSADRFGPFVDGWDYPMVIVTAAARDEPGGRVERSGCLVGFATQCGIDPPRFLVCLSISNHTYRVALRAATLAVHALSARQRDLAELFGQSSDDTLDKFAHCAWRDGPAGVPLLTSCDRWFAGRVVDRVPLGDHVGFVLEPVAASGEPDFRPLMYSQVADLRAGHPA
jgi:flavin reductase (DIM6/NTAB) family NADH-FMN oxidoreductase RutF